MEPACLVCQVKADGADAVRLIIVCMVAERLAVHEIRKHGAGFIEGGGQVTEPKAGAFDGDRGEEDAPAGFGFDHDAEGRCETIFHSIWKLSRSATR